MEVTEGERRRIATAILRGLLEGEKFWSTHKDVPITVKLAVDYTDELLAQLDRGSEL